MDLLQIFLGSALGGGVRLAVTSLVNRRTGVSFPWGTLVVNVSGAFAIGLVLGLTGAGGNAGDPLLSEFLVYGFLGSYTTVSSFSLQTLLLARQGRWTAAAGNILASLGLCLVGVSLGLLVATGLGARA